MRLSRLILIAALLAACGSTRGKPASPSTGGDEAATARTAPTPGTLEDTPPDSPPLDRGDSRFAPEPANAPPRATRGRQPTAGAAAATPSVQARVVHFRAGEDGKPVVALNRGTDAGVDRGWLGWLVDADGHRLAGSEFVVKEATPRECVAVIDVPFDELRANRHAVLAPP